MDASNAITRPSPRPAWRNRPRGCSDSSSRRWDWRKCDDLLLDHVGDQGARGRQPDPGGGRYAHAARAAGVCLDAGSPRPEPRRPAGTAAAGGLKNFLKEETSPALADKALFTLAPVVSFVPAMLTFGVIPFAAPLPTKWGPVQ